MERDPSVKYPTVAGEFETVGALLKGHSIARFGDGELKLAYAKEYLREPANDKLAAELRGSLEAPAPGCLVGIPTLDPNGPKYLN
jgi:hypothetical protein